MNTRKTKRGRFKTVQQLADYRGINRVTMHEWFRQGHPKKTDGYYSKIESDEWVLKHKPNDGHAEDTLAGVTLELKKADLWEKQRLRAEYERKMVDGEEMRKQGIAAAKQITSVITRIPAQIGSILGVEAQRRAQVIVEEALNVLKENPLGEVRT
jgi:hypothetical protein